MVRPGFHSERGFTLIELLLYVSVTAVIAGVVVGFAVMVGEIRTKAQVVATVMHEGAWALQYMGRVVRSAEDIVAPDPGYSSNSLELDIGQSVTFEVIDGTLFVTYGANDPVALTSGFVEVDIPVFSNVSRPGTPGTVRLELPMAYRASNENNLRFEYEYETQFIGSATLLRGN